MACFGSPGCAFAVDLAAGRPPAIPLDGMTLPGIAMQRRSSWYPGAHGLFSLPLQAHKAAVHQGSRTAYPEHLMRYRRLVSGDRFRQMAIEIA